MISRAALSLCSFQSTPHLQNTRLTRHNAMALRPLQYRSIKRRAISRGTSMMISKMWSNGECCRRLHQVATRRGGCVHAWCFGLGLILLTGLLMLACGEIWCAFVPELWSPCNYTQGEVGCFIVVSGTALLTVVIGMMAIGALVMIVYRLCYEPFMADWNATQ